MAEPRPPRRNLLRAGLGAAGFALLAAAGGSAGPRRAPAPGPPPAAVLAPGTTWSSALRDVPPGSVVHLGAGRHGAQDLVGLRTAGVLVRPAPGADVVVTGLSLRDSSGLDFAGFTVVSPPGVDRSAVHVTGDSHDVRFLRLTVRPVGDDARSGVEVASTGEGDPPRDVVVRDCRIDGSGARGPSSRGVLVRGPDADPSTWPRRVTLVRNDVGHAWADLVQIGGGVDVTVVDNLLHDVVDDDEHNDGVQSYASLRLRISGNRVWGGGTPSGPDQGIILGGVAESDHFTVVDSLVENNLVVGWRGQGITLAGTTRTRVRANTVAGVGGSAVVLTGVNRGSSLTNNLLQDVLRFPGEDGDGADGVTERANAVGRAATAFAPGTDHVPAPGSAAVGTADAADLPAVDYSGTERVRADAGARTVPQTVTARRWASADDAPRKGDTFPSLRPW